MGALRSLVRKGKTNPQVELLRANTFGVGLSPQPLAALGVGRAARSGCLLRKVLKTAGDGRWSNKRNF